MPSPQQKKAIVQESGYAATPSAPGSWWQVDLNDLEQSPELRWPENLSVFDAMRRQDAQVGSVLRAVTHPIRRTGWWIDPNGARPEVVQHVARDLGLPVRGEDPTSTRRLRGRFSWSDHLRLALLMLPFGHMAFEQVYSIDEATGLAHLSKLGPRLPRSIQKFNVARDGGLISILQHPVVGSTKPIEIDVSRLVMYVNEREGGNWTGMSLLRMAYKNWLIKDRLLRTQSQSIDRNGMGIPVYTAAGDEDDKKAEAEIKAGQDIAESVRAGDNSGTSLPKGSKLELMGVTGALPDADKPIRYHDEQIARAVLAHVLNLGTQTGSWALSDTLESIFTQSLQALAQYVADIATAHIVEDIVDLNWGPDEPAPIIGFDEIGSNQMAMAQAIKMLVDTNALTPDAGLEAFLRLNLKLPVKSDDTSSEPEGVQ